MANPLTYASDVVNQALDEIGAEPISEMRDGSKGANVALRHFGPTVRGLLRAAHWNFARQQKAMDLLKDVMNTNGSVPRTVPQPWLYEYQYPQDCVKVRYVPWLANQDIDKEPPLMTPLPIQPATAIGMFPAPFLVARDVELTVILTNVKSAQLVYTSSAFDPQQWDELFMAGVVAMLAAKFAMPLVEDKKMALQLRAQQIQIAKDVVSEARATNGNESWSTADHVPDWMRTVVNEILT